jgi:ribonuclease Z
MRSCPFAASLFVFVLASVSQLKAQSTDVRPPTLKVVLLGTGAGPPMDLQRYGASTLVDAGSERFLFDCGRGATLRIAQYGIRLGGVSKLFVTHLHSDHVIGIPDLFLTPWASEEARKVPFEVWGPPGTKKMMNHMQEAFAFDIRIRRDVDEKYSKEGISVSSHDIKEGVVFEKNGVKVTAFQVDHGPVKPAFGYRVDYAGHSVALSGDTRFSENLIRFSQGVDVIIHEVVDAEALRTHPGNRTREQMENIIGHHTTLQQAGEVFSRIKPRLAVYSHILGNSDDLITDTRKTYSGPLEAGEDLMTIEIGLKIEVRRFKQ